MKKNIILLLLVCMFSVVSCNKDASIELNKEVLQDKKEIRLIVPTNENDKLYVIIDDSTYLVSNMERSFINNNFFVAFFNLKQDKTKKILLIYEIESKSYECFDYYPETSYFFEDDMICFVNKMSSSSFPLPDIYEIYLNFYDFKQKESIDDVYKSRVYTTNRNVKEFHYPVPRFYKTTKKEIPANYLSGYDKVHSKDDVIYYVIWEQAHFPIFVDYYFYNSKYYSSCCAYPDEDKNEYRTIKEEFIPEHEQIVQLSKIKTKDTIVCSQKIDSYEVVVVCSNEGDSNYSNYSIITNNGNKQIKKSLDSVFKYQDKLLSIKSAKGRDGNACFIITTEEFAYDLAINLENFEYDCYLRASSFPENERGLE